MNQFSNMYYIQVNQSNGGKSCGFSLPRLKDFDDTPFLSESDIAKAEYHADMAAKAGSFDTGYYDINLYEFYQYEPIDSNTNIL